MVAIFALGWVWGLGAWIAKRGPGERYWIWLTVAQVVAGVQACSASSCCSSAGAPARWLHYVYGLGRSCVRVRARGGARGPEGQAGIEPWPWVPFAWAAFICFGLTSGLMTGLGIG